MTVKESSAVTVGSIYNLIRSSLRGEAQDYTQGSIRRAVFMLAIPMILEMGMESVFAVVDLYFVGRLPDSSHNIQTVGLTESVLSLIYSLAIGISMAATAMVARRVGEKDAKAAAHAAMQALWLSAAITVVISIIGLWLAPDILRWMGADPETVRRGTPYTRLMMGGSLVIMLLFLINGIFRGAGDASMAMKSLWIANICNIIFCPLFILGWGPFPALGLFGAAVATTLGRGIGVAYQLYHLLGGRSQIKLDLRHDWKPDFKVIRSLVNIAAPGTLQFIIGSCSWIFLARLVAETGHAEASAGYQTAIRILIFFLLPAWGMSNAAATLVGQNLGAKQPDRAARSVMVTARYNTIFMAVVMLFFLVAADWVVGFFARDPAIRSIGVQALRVISAGYIFYGIGMVMANAFNGAGDTKTPTWINLFGFWLFQIPLAYLLAKYLNWGPLGVFVAIPVAETAISLAAWYLFRKGKWKTVSI
ncbi:MATE family efflux transporter [Flavihumibacter petaseus]|uniref:Multidrug-efflux transporter n=1 Tax=Flavihumibacter petaseus NBRC 106054 TaxID=1220578 RepID=A0A0E9MZH6_9BACT|nr:MATE family efflux transporter [Flavihumibacter petaseus]GAO42801.1 putative MATE family transporter [Flavihumibacter petaseus NBRC 106054]